eukprot:753972-Hanusia_phi.AAC.8
MDARMVRAGRGEGEMMKERGRERRQGELEIQLRRRVNVVRAAIRFFERFTVLVATCALCAFQAAVVALMRRVTLMLQFRPVYSV